MGVRMLRPTCRALEQARRQMKDALEKEKCQPAPFRNGVGAFVYPCHKLVFTYCERGGSSRGMHEYLTQGRLEAWAQQHPQIEIQVEPRPSTHPMVYGQFLGGREKSFCARKLTCEEIEAKVQELANTSGRPDTRFRQPVLSKNYSVRGIWSPFHSRDLFNVLEASKKAPRSE
ncbi:39S ribosomal protein L51, mitochondrial [Dimargaris xerosporica]|nr:39S ribosomal protein L51, mitochondrial [Dimargaris xerosporica]